MRNRYPGVCYQCNKMVMKGDGFFELIPHSQRVDNQKWRLQHNKCCQKAREKKEKQNEQSKV